MYKELNFSGIYCLRNKITNKIYVGQAVNISKRLYTHKSSTYNTPISKAIRKYGINGFEVIILEKTFLKKEHKKDIQNEAEQFWLNLLKPFGKIGYNICKVANSTLGTKCKKETKNKIAKTKEKIWKFISPSGDNIIVINLRKFCRENNLDFWAMWKLHNKIIQSHKGYRKNKIEEKPHFNCKTRVFKNKEGHKFIVKDLKAFCRYNDISYDSMVALKKKNNNKDTGSRYIYKGWMRIE